MKFDQEAGPNELDSIDLRILDLLQDNCKLSLASIGEKVGLTASSVTERIHKLEDAGVIRAYVALVDGRAVGKDVTAFIGVSTGHRGAMGALLRALAHQRDVLECHHVTGGHSLLLKVKTRDTETLEQLIDALHDVDGVTRTETMVVLSTHAERTRIALPLGDKDASQRRPRRGRRGDGPERPRAGEEGR
jgi:Lrp/AsnC family transcriptional regulator, leucine-responsive regulatory protein